MEMRKQNFLGLCQRSEISIWEMSNDEGDHIKAFLGLANFEIKHFQNLFKAQREPSIAEILQIALFFSNYVEEEDNEDLMVDIIKGELLEVLHSFQKDKIPGLDGWPIEFYLWFYDLVGVDLLKVE